MKRALLLVVVPALAFADSPSFDTAAWVRVEDDNQEVAVAFGKALSAAASRADACWHSGGHLRARVGLDGGKVTSVDITRLDDRSAKDCITKMVTAVALGGAAGHSMLEIELEAQPRVPKVALLSDDPKNRKVLDAILDKNLSTNLSKFTGINGEQPSLGTGIGPGPGDGVGTRIRDKPPSVTLGPSSAQLPEGDLSAEAINRVIRARAGIFRACYQKELNRDPKLAGKVVLRFTIKHDGSPTNVAVASTTLKSPAVEGCLVKQVERLKFPANALANVTYPFVFAQGN